MHRVFGVFCSMCGSRFRSLRDTTASEEETTSEEEVVKVDVRNSNLDKDDCYKASSTIRSCRR